MSKNIFWVETEKAEFTFKTEAHQIINQIVFINVDRTQIDRKRKKSCLLDLAVSLRIIDTMPAQLGGGSQ